MVIVLQMIVPVQCSVIDQVSNSPELSFIFVCGLAIINSKTITEMFMLLSSKTRNNFISYIYLEFK